MEPTTRNATQGADAAEKLGRLKALLNFDPDNPRLARECVDLALQAGDYGFVVERADRVLASAPGDRQGLFDRASGLMGMRQYRDAAAALRTLLDRDPALAAAQFNLGLCYFCLGEHGAARPLLEALYSAGDRSPALLRVLISSLHHLGLIHEAVQVSDANPAAAASDSALAGVYALVYLDGNNIEAAGRWAAKALSSNPDSVDALVVQGTLAGARTDVSGAKAQFERALQIAPATGRAWIGLGTLALLERDLPRAKQQLSRGLQLMPSHVGSWHVLAWAHLLSGDLESAQSVLRHALELDRNFAETHGGLAAIDAIRGRIADAQRGIEVALRLDAKCLSAQFARSVLARRGGKLTDAQQIIKDTLADFSATGGTLVSRLIGRATRH